MKCLNDAQIQALVDDEAAEDIRRHAAACARCGERLRARESLTTALVDAMNVPAALPPRLRHRVDEAIAAGGSAGATRLRSSAPPRRAWRPAIWSAGAVAAATVTAILVVAPMIKGPSMVSAAEVLARSAGQLAERVTTGFEYLEYELTLDGVPREMLPDHIDGAYRVKQVIDHDTPGRYFLATYGPDGTVISALAQDPANHRRVMSVRVAGQPFRFEVIVPEHVVLSPPEMQRLHMEASVTMMQASGDQHLRVIETPDGPQYLIEVPSVSSQTPNAVWDLAEARVLVDASDYHIVEFFARGTFLKQPYSVSYRLINRSIGTEMTVQASEFELPEDATAIRIQGQGSAIPLRDLLVLALRELARAKQAR
jgi:hypothetical protein